MPLAFLLLLLCALLLLGLMPAWRQNRFFGLASGTFALVLPAILLFGYVDRTKDPFGRFTLRLTGIALNQTDGAPPLRVGGDPACDDLVIENFPAHAVSITAERVTVNQANPAPDCDTQRAGAAPSVPDSAGNARTVFLSFDPPMAWWQLQRDPEIFAQSVPLLPRDAFCLAQCSSPDGRWFVVREDGRSLALRDEPDAVLPPFPERQLIPFVPPQVHPAITEYRPSQAIFPLRDYGIPLGAEFRPFDPPCEGRQLCDRATASPVLSFLFFGDDNRLNIALLDPGATLSPDADARQPRRSLPLAGGGKVHVWEVRYSDVLTDFVEEPRASHLRKRLTLGISQSASGTRLGFGTSAPARAIAAEDIRAAARGDMSGSPEWTTVFVGGRQVGQTDFAMTNVVRFDALGGRLARGLLAGSAAPIGISFSEKALAPAGSVLPSVSGAAPDSVTASQINQLRFSQQTVAAAPGRVELALDRLVYPEPLAPVVIGWTLFLLYLLAVRLQDHARVTAVLAVLQMMLAWRILVAFGSFGHDPSISPPSALAEVMVAFFAVPALFLSLIPSIRWRTTELAAMAIVVGALGWTLINTDLLDRKHAALPGAVVLTLLLRIFARRYIETIAAKLLRFASRWGRPPALPPPAKEHGSEEVATAPLLRIPFDRALLWWAGCAFVLATVRFGLLFIGAKEQLWGMRISVAYLPLAIFIWAGLIDAMQRATRAREVWLAISAMLLLLVIMPVLASDNGFTLIFSIPPSLLLLLAVYRRFHKTRPRAFVWGITGAMVLLICGYGSLGVLAPWLTGMAIGSALVLALGALADWHLRSRTDPEKPATPRSPGVALALAVSIMAVGVLWVPGAVVKALWSETAYSTSLAKLDEDDRSAEDVVEAVARYQDQGVNTWRLNAIFNPAAINESGLDEGERLRRWRYTLERLSVEPFGRGFPYSANIAEVRVNQADDNVSAVHIMAPFGRAAGSAFVLLLATIAYVTLRAAPRVSGYRRATGSLALWCFAIAGSYMIAANLSLLPFTGRNVYLLAAFSFSDLLEGTILLVLATVALDRWTQPVETQA